MALDWDDIPTDNLPKARHVARLLYNRIGRVSCPALNNEAVVFNAKGIHHLVYKPMRDATELIERLGLLRYAEEVITHPDAEVVYRNIQERGRRDINAHYWTLRKLINGWIVKVVIKQEGCGQKFFYSIMGRKI